MVSRDHLLENFQNSLRDINEMVSRDHLLKKKNSAQLALIGPKLVFN